MLRKILIGLAALSCVSAPAFTQENMSDAERIAREYMMHYDALDLDAMEDYWADDVEFFDVTAMGPETGPDGIAMQSGAEAREMLSDFIETNQPIELGFEWHTIFESNGRVIFMGEVNALYPTPTDGQVFRWNAEQVTVITVRDGQIIRQRDFANYANPDRSLVRVP
ncbi:MAG: nuclear transport factor 2 family protein [Maricaulis sp.]|jgi:ketosteroid isomerase-like protein|nr:nuclear transport factor 2 family protein [Maricaulis sp.]MDG2043277.1 nuclear transport factor 2 family protein [Maricaulis sp.]